MRFLQLYHYPPEKMTTARVFGRLQYLREQAERLDPGFSRTRMLRKLPPPHAPDFREQTWIIYQRALRAAKVHRFV